MTDKRAVSDTVGFVLVFSLVLLSVAGVSVVGMSGLSDRQDAEQVRNVERAFDVLADNLHDVQRFEDPSRGTEIRLGGGTLGFGEEVTVSVAVHDDATGDVVGNATEVRLRPIEYRKGGSTVVYEGGALIRSSDGGAYLFDEPAFVVDEEARRGSFPLVATRLGGEQIAVGGKRTVLVQGRWSGVRSMPDPLEADASQNEHVRVNVTSPRAAAWERYFEEHESFTVVERSDGTVSARVEADTVYVSAVRVVVSLRR